MTLMEQPPRYHIAALLKERGISPTQQRIEIGQLLFARPQHVSAEQLLEQVNKGRARVSKATIYNTLNLFSRKGLVREIIVDPTKVFYDSNTTGHHHFFNVDTGELTDVPPDVLGLAQLPAVPAGTVLDGVDVIIRIRAADRPYR